jgi:hypothetical protein
VCGNETSLLFHDHGCENDDDDNVSSKCHCINKNYIKNFDVKSDDVKFNTETQSMNSYSRRNSLENTLENSLENSSDVISTECATRLAVDDNMVYDVLNFFYSKFSSPLKKNGIKVLPIIL